MKKKPSSKKSAKSYRLTIKGKPLNSFLTESVKKVAEIKKVKVNTPKRLHDYFEKNKEAFIDRFTIGETSFRMGVPAMLKDFDKAERYNKTFVVVTDGKEKEVSKAQMVYELTMTENYINDTLGTSMFTMSYIVTYDGKVKIKVPKRVTRPEWSNEMMEDISDYLNDEYDIMVYSNEAGDSGEPREKAYEKKAKSYKKGVKTRLAAARKAVKGTRKKSVKRKKR